MNELSKISVHSKKLKAVEEKHKQLEDELRKDRERLDFLLTSVPVVVYAAKTSGDFSATFVAASSQALLGYKPEEFTSNSGFWPENIHPDDRERVFEKLPRIFERGHLIHEYRFRRADGIYRWMRDELKLLYDSKGNPIEIVGFWMDITEHKCAEEELHESETKFRKLTEAAFGGIAVTEKGRFIDVSDQFAVLFGYRQKELIGMHAADLIAPGVRAETVEKILSGYDKPYESLCLRKDGSTFPVEVCGKNYYSKGRELRVTAIRDITQQKIAEEEAKKLDRELEQKVLELTEVNRELDAFNYTVSHDLKVPLVIIGGFINRFLKKQGNNLDAKEKEMFNIIQEHTQKMERLIKDLLAFSHVGRQKIKPTDINTGNLVTTVLEELEPLSEGRFINYDIKPLPTARGDQTLIEQVFFNLLSNAIKFTTNKKTAIIEVGGLSEESENIYYVKDNGMGFNSQDSDKLFDVFQRLHGVEKLEGSGVGLSIVQRIVKRHGGQVWAEGKVNDGASFYFSLPNKISEDS
jgi:PAS domain S-box-containing protein